MEKVDLITTILKKTKQPFTKTGAMSKRVEEEIDQLLTKLGFSDILNGMISKINPVDAMAFTGLTVACYYGIVNPTKGLLGAILFGGAEDMATALLSSSGVAALTTLVGAGSAVAGAPVPAEGIKNLAVASLALNRLQGEEREYTKGEMEDLWKSVAEEVKATKESVAEDAIAQKELNDKKADMNALEAALEEIDFKLWITSVAISMGMAGLLMWFMKSYSFSEFSDNVSAIADNIIPL